MTASKVAVVVTTIQDSTQCMQSLGRQVHEHGMTWIVIGDRKGPVHFAMDSAEFVSIDRQATLPFRLAHLLPENHYTRKNLGYLMAMARGCNCIYETDDDNAPTDAWQPRSRKVSAHVIERRGAAHWANVYAVYSRQLIWPRGLPLKQVRRAFAEDFSLSQTPVSVDAPIQQGLANGSPDVDAVWRLVLDRDFHFDIAPNVLLPRGMWCPFNSQNTWWWRDAFPLLYLPSYCSFRMTDIWRSFVAQRCLWELGHELEFHGADVHQARNEHDYLRDFDQEIPGYLHNDRIRRVLEDCELHSGPESLTGNILECYEALASAAVVGSEEPALVEAWLEDCAEASKGIQDSAAANITSRDLLGEASAYAQSNL